MPQPFRLAAAAVCGVSLILGASSAAAANLSVDFVHPETYTDAAYTQLHGSEPERKEVEQDIEKHLQQLAERSLAPGDTLQIDVLDIDLAGRVEPIRSAQISDLRIVRESDWPRMKLRYTLSRDGRVVSSAEEKLSDMSFLMSLNRYPSGDRIRYEKAMLDAWFAKRFGKPAH